MGRTTPSLRIAVKRQLSRIESILNLLPECEAERARRLFNDLDETISLYTHSTSPIDPVELLLVHLIRRIVRGECRNAFLGYRRGSMEDRGITLYSMGEWDSGKKKSRPGV
ncbi:MAG: hypothetical protein GSR79_04720 [Desulfurococcales archaeon]|nr:hypothetical protein [Desulfurococcales archaeon]